jgi:predicted ATPase
LGGIAVKGKGEPVQSFRVLGRKASPGRLRGIEGLESPLIGREQEFEMLQTAANCLQQGAGGIIYLVGEAGLGKSRLIQELKSAIENMPFAVQWIESQSYSYETEQPYALFQRLIRRLLDPDAGDSPQLLREKFKLIVDEMPAEEQEGLSQVLESLFGLKREDGQPPLQGEAFKGRLYTVMAQYWRYRAEQGPVVLVADDLHWLDPASAALLQHLFPLSDQVPLLFLCALRPEQAAPGWAIRQSARNEFPGQFTEILLRPLNHERSGRLVDNLLRVTDLPRQLRERILDKSEGNPFFVEEVVRTLIDQGIVVQDENSGRWRVASERQSISPIIYWLCLWPVLTGWRKMPGERCK